MKKIVILTITAFMLANGIAYANTRLIEELDILDVWELNFNASHWLEQGNLRVGQQMYGEEPLLISSLSDELTGADWIQCAFGSKSFTDPVIAYFRVKEDADVFIAHNNKADIKPGWLDLYVQTGYSLVNSRGETFTFYVRRFRKGETVALGNNGSTLHSMYLVAVKPVNKSISDPKPAGDIFDVVTFGALGDGRTLNTGAIQKAIDKASQSKKGGTVYIHDGIFITGSLRLKDNVTLFVEQGAILRGSVNHTDYLPVRCQLNSYRGHEDFQLIYAENARNISITGGGIIDGYSLYEGWPWKGRNNEHERPRLVRMVTCEDVFINDITLIRSANWTQYYENCTNLQVKNVKVRCYTGTNNQDGIDVSACRNVTIEKFDGICGDDVICIKSLSMLPGENIVVDGVRSRYSNCNIVKIGTETHGAVRNMRVRNVEGWTRYALAIESVDGAIVEDVVYENIKLHTCSAPFVVKLGNRGRIFPGSPEPSPVGIIRNITLRNIKNTDIRYALDRGGPGVGAPIAGIPGHPVQNVTIEDCDLLFYGSVNDPAFVYRDVPENEDKYPEFHIYGTCPAYGIYFRHVDGLTCRNVVIRTKNRDVRPAVVMDDVQNYSFSDVRYERFSTTEPYGIWHKQDGEIIP